jgi:ureidoacrylate peracid hydrolase
MNTALVVVDMQKAFCNPEGSFQRRGYVIENIGKIIEQCINLRKFADETGWTVFFTRLVYSEGYQGAGLLVQNNPQIRQLGGYIEGSPDSMIVDELTPKQGDIVINKNRFDPFITTTFYDQLCQFRIKKIVVCGVCTNICVESTVRGAFDRDIRVIIAEDAVTSYSKELHQASLETLRVFFASVLSVAKIEESFRRI